MPDHDRAKWPNDIRPIITHAVPKRMRNQPASWDAEDVAQEILSRVLSAQAAFDPARGSGEAFVTVVARNALTSLKREWSAAKRNERNVYSLDAVVPQDEGEWIPLSQLISAPRPHGRDHDLDVDLRIDLAWFIERLPAPLRDFLIAFVLENGNLEATRRRLGLTSWVARTRLALLRQKLIDRDFDDYCSR